MTPLALRYMGDGEFRALHPRLADKALVIGEVHRWEIVSDRSADSHRHYFAVLNEAWQNLPEALAMDFPSPEHLRKWALIQSGYCTMTKLAFRTNADAVKAAAVMQALDDYAEIGIHENAVVMRRATSQNMRAMNRTVFQESKDKVLQAISHLVGADVTELKGAA